VNRLPFFFIALLFFVSSGCKKNDVAIPYGNATYYSETGSQNSNTGGPFSFTAIIVNPNPVQKGTAAKVIAKASGANLTFKWSTPHGELFGNGSTIYYSDSCIGTFQITCTVSDGTNSVTLAVPVTVSN
jgi:hypothetical protein